MGLNDSLSLPPLPLCPPGLVYPTESAFISRLREMEKTQQEDSIPLIPSTPQELEDMLRLCCYTPLKLPRQVHSWAAWSYIHIKTFNSNSHGRVSVCVARSCRVSLTTGSPTMVSTKSVSLLTSHHQHCLLLYDLLLLSSPPPLLLKTVPN